MKSFDKLYTLITLLSVILATGCSTTRRIPEGEILYTGVKKVTYIKSENTNGVKTNIPSGLEEQVAQSINVAPNNSLQ